MWGGVKLNTDATSRAQNARTRTDSLDALPDGLKPRLRLFLSVDIVGSTKLKQSLRDWQPVLLSFYRDFDYILATHYKQVAEQSPRAIPAPEFWKSNGDELLYTCELANLDHAHDALRIWLDALRDYRDHAARQDQKLDVKGTAWIGLFPVPNAEVFFHRGAGPTRAKDPGDAVLMQASIRDDWYTGKNRREIIRDFVGPSIDTGFRLTSWARPDRLIVSVDLAFLLTSSYSWSAGKVDAPLPLHYSGREKLKGVIDNEPYPTIWIPVTEAQPVGREPELADPEVLRTYCEAVIEQNYRFITPLFLSGHGAHDFDWAPPFIITQILAQWGDEVRYRETAAARG